MLGVKRRGLLAEARLWENLSIVKMRRKGREARRPFAMLKLDARASGPRAP